MHKLLIKNHKITGLKYLCYTTKKNHYKYRGSGKYWKRHIKIHGYDNVETILIFQTENYEEFKKIAIEKSLEFNIVESTEWANLRLEEATGGSTSRGKMWITNGNKDLYILKNDLIPDGWYKGRSNCVFNNSENQRQFGKMGNNDLKKIKLKEAWANRENNKFSKIDYTNRIITDETKKLISEKLKGRIFTEEHKKNISLAKTRKYNGTN